MARPLYMDSASKVLTPFVLHYLYKFFHLLSNCKCILFYFNWTVKQAIFAYVNRCFLEQETLLSLL